MNGRTPDRAFRDSIPRASKNEDKATLKTGARPPYPGAPAVRRYPSLHIVRCTTKETAQVLPQINPLKSRTPRNM